MREGRKGKREGGREEGRKACRKKAIGKKNSNYDYTCLHLDFISIVTFILMVIMNITTILTHYI